ncbi:MAG: hypothetical protein EX271_09270 [Acidimicrobiales bacterium]|nr:hypothetical protein [Hyphomonadaceae bacterium]RZV40868.1 MAG: hypothetical protein EX271_09270 [Acidimicrobiales bacterium]
MNRLEKCVSIGIALFALSGCATYGDASTYAHMNCEALRTLYSPGTNIGNTPDVLLSDSDYNAPKPNELTWANANLARNATAKRESDLRAAYRANGC